MADLSIYFEEVDKEKYVIATYYVETWKTLNDVAWAIAIGQSIGNPGVRNDWESTALVDDHCCKILHDEDFLKGRSEGIVKIAFPSININWKEDGIAHLLCNLMGGQMDIDIVKKCQLKELEFPKHVEEAFMGPKYGIKGIREYTQAFDQPLLGGIIKPKTGLNPDQLLDMVKQLVEGGVNFIKEDEILSNPSFCTIEDRVPMVMEYLNSLDRKVIYAVCINADYPYLFDRVRRVHELGGNAVHVNFWAGLGVYKAIREMDLPLFLFFQKSGDKILTQVTHDYHIDWNVVCKLAGMMGVDFIHAGMWGGYMNNDESTLRKTLNILYDYDVMPSLSCGMNADLIAPINEKFGTDYLANVGGAIHGHPNGTLAGAQKVRDAIDDAK
ncbi:MAG: RuBisCO large subunit C-terminal-like domain-containing protein [Nitrosomonadaceae bacterium]